MKYWLLGLLFLLPPVYEYGAVSFHWPDYFSWLLWYLLYAPVIAISINILKAQKSLWIRVAISLLVIAYIPYVVSVNSVKDSFFFKKNRRLFIEYTNHVDSLKKIGVEEIQVDENSVYFYMNTDSDWKWGYAHIIEEGNTTIIDNMKLKKLEDSWYLFY